MDIGIFYLLVGCLHSPDLYRTGSVCDSHLVPSKVVQVYICVVCAHKC